MIEKMMDNMSNALRPLAWMVDIFPWIHHLPEGCPGTSYRKTAREMTRVNDYVSDAPYYLVRKQFMNAAHRPSYVSALIEKLSGSSSGSGELRLNAVDEDTIKHTAATMYAGGSDTSVSSLTSFALAMIKFPEVQRRGQQEIDDVIGTQRLPVFADRQRLPYVDAMVKELLRWFPVTPIGTAHNVDEDIDYAGYKIPKGSYLLPAVWWFLHDPDVYANPLVFDPARFLEPRNEPDPTTACFGYGRRICPGRFLADANIFITAVRLLSTFNIKHAIDCEGREIEPRVKHTPGLVSRPVSFQYKMEPRSAEHAALIRRVEAEHPWESGDAAYLEGFS
jgi:cytochrome P450